MTLRLLRFLLPLALLAGTAHAQIVASMRLTKSQYVAGEPVMAIVTITNHSGGELILRSEDRVQWLDFIVKNANGEPVSSPPTKNFGALRMGAGQSLANTVNLSQHYRLMDPGNFSVSAVVRMPGGDSVSTNRELFSVNSGRLYWSQKVGVPGKPGDTREYRLLSFTGNQKTELYAQVINGRTGLPMNTFLLGESLSLRKPVATVDKNQRMHVLYLATPSMFVHYEVTIDGQRAGEPTVHQRAGQGDPQLVTSKTGEVMVANSVIHDQKAIDAARAKQRKASDRPAFIYE